MATNVRILGSNDPRFYSPERDLAYMMPFVAKRVAQRIERELLREGSFYRLTSSNWGITDEELGQAAEAYCKYITTAALFPSKNPKDAVACLTAAGWFEIREEVQYLYMAAVGQVFTNMYFPAAKAATVGGVPPDTFCPGIEEAGAQAVARTTRFSISRLLRRLFQRSKT